MPFMRVSISFGDRWYGRGFAEGETVFGWVLVSTGFITLVVSQNLFNHEGRQESGGRSKFRSYALTTFSRLVNCVLIRFLSTSVERPLYKHQFDYSNAPKFLVIRDSVSEERPRFSVTSPRPVYGIKLKFFIQGVPFTRAVHNQCGLQQNSTIARDICSERALHG